MRKRLAFLLLACILGNSLEARDWTVYIYMQATDAYQEAQAAVRHIQDSLKDDHEARIVVYIDMQVGSKIDRITIERGSSISKSCTISGGQKEVLKEGILRAFSTPHEGNTILILSGHGTGILSPSFDSAAKKWLYEHDEGASPAKRYVDERSKQFGKQVEYIMRGKSMLNLQTDSSYLSTLELRELVAFAASVVGRKLDIVGFDSCYMAMLEVAYQIKDYVQHMISSQDCEEKDGWDYASVIQALRSSSPQRAGRRIVYGYERGQLAKGYDRFSLSLFDLASLDAFTQAFDRLIYKMVTTPRVLDLICCARMALHPVTGLHFYVDLKEFLEAFYNELLGRTLTPEGESLVEAILESRELLGVLVDASVSGPASQSLHGCSLYFPVAHIDSSYTGLFVHERRWIDFLRYFTTGTTEGGSCLK